jgi:hypothetical protein
VSTPIRGRLSYPRGTGVGITTAVTSVQSPANSAGSLTFSTSSYNRQLLNFLKKITVNDCASDTPTVFEAAGQDGSGSSSSSTEQYSGTLTSPLLSNAITESHTYADI